MDTVQFNELLNRLVNQPHESEWLEFKKDFHSAEEIGERISALANGACLNEEAHGYLVFGVEDGTHEIVGAAFSAKNKKAKGGEDLEFWITQRLSPKIDFKIYEQTVESDKRVIIFEIPAATNCPVEFFHHAYIRIGSYTKKLQEFPNKQAKIWRKQITDWSAEICANASIADLSSEAIEKARFLFADKNPKLKADVTSWDDATFLNKAKLCIKGNVTNTALLLLGKPESEHFINPASSRITWILKDKDNFSKDYEHFEMPLLLAVEQVYAKIRNLKYRYLSEGSLFPHEVDEYDPYIIREALHNCIAHQDYRLNGNIVLVETEDATLTFANSGEFIPQSVERVIEADAPEQNYRNRFLVDAMVNLKMIDTIGSGIQRIFRIQKDKFFPLPDYDLSNNKVKVTIFGKVLDMRYACKLAQMPDLSLHEIMLLDKIQKNQPITDDGLAVLRKKGLVEGRKPNLYISSSVAKHADLQKNYIEMRGLDDKYYQTLVVEYLKKFKQAKRSDIDELLLDKLPMVLDEVQKNNKIKNLLQSLKKQEIIKVSGKFWCLFK